MEHQLVPLPESRLRFRTSSCGVGSPSGGRPEVRRVPEGLGISVSDRGWKQRLQSLLRTGVIATKKHKSHKPFCVFCAFLWLEVPDLLRLFFFLFFLLLFFRRLVFHCAFE